MFFIGSITQINLLTLQPILKLAGLEYVRIISGENKGNKVLEMRCGDCENVVIMAAFGANFFANYNAIINGEIVRKLNENNTFKRPIVFVEGGFWKIT